MRRRAAAGANRRPRVSQRPVDVARVEMPLTICEEIGRGRRIPPRPETPEATATTIDPFSVRRLDTGAT
jgi:hypothetical protein